MSAISEMEEHEWSLLALSYAPDPPAWWIEALALIFYRWADDNAHLVVIKKKILLFTVTITVKDCAKLVEWLVGPRPIVQP